MSSGYGKMGLGILLLAVAILTVSPSQGATITENFAANQFNPKLWRLSQDMGQGATPQVINESLEVNVAGNGYAVFSGDGFTLIGDFDMKVDFTLIEWPASNGTQLTIGTFLASETDTVWPQVGRANAPWDTMHGHEVYFTSMTNFNNIGVTGPPSNGTLRMVRTGNKVEGFYLESPEVWKSIGAATDASQGVRVGVSMSIGPYANTYSGIPSKSAFSNIRIDYTTLGPGFGGGNPGPGIMMLLGD